MRPALFALSVLLVVACAREAPQVEPQSEWREVLEQKKAAVAAEASATHKQAYADSLAAFVRRHPNHSRAREVYHRIQLEFADELVSLGRYQDAIRFYRAVAAHDPDNEEARRGLTIAADRLAVTTEKLEQLQKGMTAREVASHLGKPIPGWTIKRRSRGTTIEAWYYRTTSGGLAGVYFRDGEVFAAEADSQAPFGL